MRAQDFPQGGDLLAHTIEHLPDRIHADLAALVAVESKPNRKVLGEPQQHRIVRLHGGYLRAEIHQRLPQQAARVVGKFLELLLQQPARPDPAALTAAGGLSDAG